MINFKKKKTSMLVVFLLITSCSLNQIGETPSIQKNKEKYDSEISKIQNSVIYTPKPVIINEKENPSPVLVNNNNNPPKVLSINYMPKTINLDVGKSTTIKANVTLSNNFDFDYQIICDDPNLVKIDVKSGLVTAIKSGSGVIKIISNKDRNIFVEIPIVINSEKVVEIPIVETTQKVIVSFVSINPSSVSLKVGDTLDLVANVNLSNGVINSKVSWLSLNENILKVDSVGRITALASGEARVEVASIDDNGKRAIVNVIISKINEPLPPPRIVVDSIILLDKSLNLNIGDTKKLSAIVKFSDGSTNSLVKWSSSDNSIFSIDSTVL